MSAVTNLFIPVKDISPLQGPWWTTVQVIRMWHKTFCSQPTRILSVEIVFIDKQGTKIQGSVSQDILRMRRLDMDEGNHYDLIGAFTVPNDGEDRPTSHPYRLVFDISSQIVLVEKRSLTSFGLSPLTIVDIQRRKTQTQDPVDKVGILTTISCERRYVRNDRQVNAVFLEITDPTGRTECVLYDEYVEDARQFLNRHGPCTPIIVVQFARIVSHGHVIFGDAAIEDVVSATRLAFNPTIPEVFDMKNWLVMNGVRLEGRLKYQKMDEPQSSMRDEFLLYHKKSQIGQLLRGAQVGLYVVFATITSLLDDEIWWFSGCKHHNYPFEASPLHPCDGYYCVSPRYNLKVEVSDGKDITYLLLGDDDVYKLLQVPCKELLTKIQRSSSIARLVVVPGDEAYYHHADCSSYASAMPDENFHTADSDVGQMSSSSSVSYKNNFPRETGDLDKDL